MATRKPTIDPRSFARSGAAHRQEQHIPRVHGTSALDEGSGTLPPSPSGKDPRGGRPKIFEVPTSRLNLFLPQETVKRIRMMAVQQGVSPSQLVDVWARRMEVIEGVTRGMEDFEKGEVVSHEEALKRLSRW